MSGFAPAPHKPDGRIFASYPMPAKIDLLNERPRRESLVEKELENKIGETSAPRIEIQSPQSDHQEQEQQYNNVAPVQSFQQAPRASQHQELSQSYQQNQVITTNMMPQYSNQQQHQQRQHLVNNNIVPAGGVQSSHTTTSTSTITSATINKGSNNAAMLAAELAQKEAKLMDEINALHQRPYSPFQIPDKIDLTNEQRIAQRQFEQAPSPRPYSRTSSNRSATSAADLLDKEAKLMQEIEEMERKPFNPQRMVVEREEWFEYPQGKPYDMHLTDSKRRIKDFCDLPSHMYPDQGVHVHEENLLASGRPSSSANSVHTTIIKRSPRREVDNKSPLPFAFDNFSTKGVRGNIASVGAVEPDRPRPPIYPIIKRTPSPNMARG